MNSYWEHVKERLTDLGVNPSKDRGQNFLVDLAALESIIEFGRPKNGEHIVEIGGGLGALTAELAHFDSCTVIEIEEAFCKEIAVRYPSVHIVHSDVREFDLSSLGDSLVVFGNLPYSFSSDIIYYLLEYAPCIQRAVIMLQKEFAERLFASPGSKKYGPLSILTALRAEVFPGPIIDGECFYPNAAVESQVVELLFHPKSPLTVNDMYVFQQILTAAFYKRRRKMVNSVGQSKTLSMERFIGAMDTAGIAADQRAEDIAVKDFITLANAYSAGGQHE